MLTILITDVQKSFKKGGLNLSQTDKGVLMYFEWLEAMSSLDAKTYKSMMNAIWHCQQTGKKPPAVKGKARVAASIICPCIERRIALSKAGKRGAEKRNGLYGVNPVIDELLAAKALKDASRVASSEDQG